MRLIDADALSKQVHYSMEDDPYSNSPACGQLSRVYNIAHKHILRIIDEAPTIGAEPVRRGRLVSTGTDELYCEWGDCTVCGSDNRINAKFCNNCGAKIEGIVTR